MQSLGDAVGHDTGDAASPLPIDAALPAIRDALRHRNGAVVQAPPGAGKTTRVPPALLGEPWLGDQRIVMLEPRRLATRASARRMAETLGEDVGETVGYRVRMERRVGPRTRIEVVTEGILTRMLQSDPTLDGIGAVIFDEFHERSVHADVGLALTLQTQRLLRDDLRILVMSATLDAAPVAALLGDAPIITSEGRSYPVETRYVERRPNVPLERAITGTIRDALTSTDGDILVFLPGAGEIGRVADQLDNLPPNVRVAPLYGMLSQQEQDLAIEPSPRGRRKIVLSTSIAETSLTIEGVRVVVDSGLMRVPRFDPNSGMTRLDTVRVSRASADQRQGRAGRVAPGVCYRLWGEHEQHGLLAHRPPEIMETDLAPVAMELASAGIDDPRALPWLDVPPLSAFAQARTLLRQLGALDDDGRMTSYGREMAGLGTHPRLAHMLLEGVRRGEGELATLLAALLGNVTSFFGDGAPVDVDLRLRADALIALRTGLRTGHGGDPVAAAGYRLDRTAAKRLLTEARIWQRQLNIPDQAPRSDACGVLLALAYPDRIAQRRPGPPGRYRLRNGRGAAIPTGQPLSTEEFLVVADIDGKLPESRIFLAAAISRDDVLALYGDDVTIEPEVAWDETTGAVRARIREQLGALTLSDAPWRDPNPDDIASALLDVIRRNPSSLPWTDAARAVQTRVNFLRTRDETWPDLSDDTLAATMETWLAPYLAGLTRLEQVQQLNLAALLLETLSRQQRSALDERAPTHYTAPTGSRIEIDYTDPTTPTVSIRLQEMFGVVDTPRVDRGTVPITLHLLSPAHRPVQVTRDLGGFWKGSYFDVKRDLKGRYPKHEWPDDPVAAAPTNRAKRRPT